MEEAGTGGGKEYTYTCTYLRKILNYIRFALSLQLHAGMFPVLVLTLFPILFS